MDINTKNQLKAELTGVRALAQGASGLASTVGAQIAFPVPLSGSNNDPRPSTSITGSADAERCNGKDD
jgi:hypothetical protein